MKLSEIKEHLRKQEVVNFQLPNGAFVPEHFHITEVGVIDKHFIDCGGTVRREKVVSLQLWNANDLEHRLQAGKLLSIIAQSEKILGIEDLEVEVEYQDTTIGKYGIEHNGTNFLLTNKQTNCLAKENCGVPKEKKKLQLTELSTNKIQCCTPDGECC